MSPYQRTFKLDRLYNQFLKLKGIPRDRLPFLVSKLYEHGFIELVRSDHAPDLERYSETAKLTSRQHRDELFKLIEGLKS